MNPSLYRATLELQTAFGTPLVGDTLFGQLCWAVREHFGEAELTRLLQGYTSSAPWLVVSDGFPTGYLPKPTLPQVFAQPIKDAGQRKAEKSKCWIPLDDATQPLGQLLQAAVNNEQAFAERPIESVQSHNTLNRLTGTTGEGEFAPYTQTRTFYARQQKMDLYLVIDNDRMAIDKIELILDAIGNHGFGRDATTGLGKFTLTSLQTTNITTPDANAYWTLAPSAPQGQGFDSQHSYWQVLTRFGRHGGEYALTGKPYKTPVLLAATGAVFTPQDKYQSRLFVGQGIGGNGELSKIEPATVQQGYAPVIGLQGEGL